MCLCSSLDEKLLLVFDLTDVQFKLTASETIGVVPERYQIDVIICLNKAIRFKLLTSERGFV